MNGNKRRKENVLRKSRCSKILIAVLIVVGLCFAKKFTEFSIAEYEGNNEYDHFLHIEIVDKGYDDPGEALEAAGREYTPNESFCEMETDGYLILFFQDGNRIVGEEMRKRGGKYYYIGYINVTFDHEQQEDKGYELTVKADVEQMVNTHKDFLDLDKKYGALPVWGVTKSEKIYETQIDGLKIDGVEKFEYLGTNYYLWYIRDFSEDMKKLGIELTY